ncbi:hypothetical protein F0267_23100 [Vibrio coralliilyticus]|nr:hypothetical protein [Vibrio coralliilyticus]NOH41119.1 hypothetical protein [Vibrio coralliilyticus]
MSELSNKILERHVQALDPEAYALIHRLLSEGMLDSNIGVSMISTIRKVDRVSGFPRPTNLRSHSAENEERLKPIVELGLWVRKEYQQLSKSNDSGLKEPCSLPKPTNNNTPACRMTMEKMVRQAEALKQHREKA